MRIGILGGTFDPPHIGHLIVADEVRSALELDVVLFIPAKVSPHKRGRKSTAAKHRLKLVKLAVKGMPHFRVSDLEIRRGGVSYTVDTLKQLHHQRPHDDMFLLIGMDNLRKLHTWKSPRNIQELSTVVVMTRPGFSAKSKLKIPRSLAAKTVICPVPEIAVSSTDIRQRVREGRPFRHLVTESVYHYIVSRGLYANR